MADKTQRHDLLAREFITKVAGKTESFSELMVVVESSLFGTLMIMEKLHGFKPSHSVEMVEAAVLQAVERYTARRDHG